MRLPYLSKKNSGWQVQIRMPATLDPGLCLSPIRRTIPAMPAIQARRKAVALVSAVLNAIAEVERMNQTKHISPKKARDAVSMRIDLAIPTLAGLDALDGPDFTEDRDLVESSFGVLAQIGYDRAKGGGAFADGKIRHEQAVIAGMRVAKIAEAMTERPSSERNMGNLTPIEELLTQPDKIAELESTIRTVGSLGMTPVTQGPLFSKVLEDAIKEVMGRKYAKNELVGLYRKVGKEFIAIVGDRPIGTYRRKDLQHYANEIAWLPPRTSSKKNYKHSDVVKYIERNKREQGQGLAAKTIREGRVSHLKAIIGRGCADHDQQNRVANTRITIPDRARPPSKHKRPMPHTLSRVLNVAVDTEALSNVLMLVLGTLSGRRLGLLAFLRREDVNAWAGVHVIDIATHRYENGIWMRVPYKSDDSRSCVVIPNILVELGFVEWAQSAPGPMFPEFMACEDPGDAAQKRLNRVIQKIVEAEGLPRFTYHGLRGGRIDDARDAKVEPHLIQHQVGHKPQSVHELYQSLTPEMARAIASQPLPKDVEWSFLERIDYGAPQVPTRKRRTSAQIKYRRVKSRGKKAAPPRLNN